MRNADGRLGGLLAIVGLVVVVLLVPFGLLVVATRPVNDVDARVVAELHAFALAHPGVTRVLIVWTDVFGPWSWRVVVVAVAGWLVYRGAMAVAVWAVGTMAVGGVLGWVLKIVTARGRPQLPDPVALAPGPAFPSGHAVNVTLGAGVLVLLLLPVLPRWGRRVAWAVAGFLVLSVSGTRAALGVHWVSDVAGGIVLGVAVLAATTAAYESWRREAGRRPAAVLSEGVAPESAKALRARR